MGFKSARTTLNSNRKKNSRRSSLCTQEKKTNPPVRDLKKTSNLLPTKKASDSLHQKMCAPQSPKSPWHPSIQSFTQEDSNGGNGKLDELDYLKMQRSKKMTDNAEDARDTAVDHCVRSEQDCLLFTVEDSGYASKTSSCSDVVENLCKSGKLEKNTDEGTEISKIPSSVELATIIKTGIPHDEQEKLNGVEHEVDINTDIDSTSNDFDFIEQTCQEISTAAESSRSLQCLQVYADSSMLIPVLSDRVILPDDCNKSESIDWLKSVCPDQNGVDKVKQRGVYSLPHAISNDHDYWKKNVERDLNILSTDSSECPDHVYSGHSKVLFSGYGGTITGTVNMHLSPSTETPPKDTQKSNIFDTLLDNWNGILGNITLLKTVGLSYVNLASLVDSNSIAESSCDRGVEPRRKQHDARVEQRRRDFRRAMQTSSSEDTMKREIHTCKGREVIPLCKDPLMKRWLKLDDLGIDDMHKLLEDTTDILYLYNQRNTTAITRPSGCLYKNASSPNQSRGTIKCTRPVSFRDICLRKDSQFHHDNRSNVARLMARTKHVPSSINIKKSSTDADHSPAVLGKSKLITEFRCMDIKLSNDPTDDGTVPKDQDICSHPVNKKLEKEENAACSTRNLRSRKVNINNVTKKCKNVDKKKQKQEIKKSPTESEENSSQCKEVGSVDEWITLSEEWLKEPLDETGLLNYI